MPRAFVNDQVIAESEHFESVEGNVYFPPSALVRQFFRESDTHTTCGWKGEASYYDLVVDENVLKDAAWYYANPKAAAINIRDHVAFDRRVRVET
ncbi:MAG: DUF427 domain-containing protein [Spirochaetales bacterium]|nr:DUF427 domain-containing protein [Leptospiraceae bacterium]MCP5483027.1 DUF427 domain-containing protein [Spirochaetales bacterium]MCP5486167.1 DUF427 domain-containing protein [Spirochaetales bacterium]